MTDKIKILHITTDIGMGGTIMALYRLLANINPERFDNRVISLTGRSYMSDMLEHRSIPVSYMNMRGGFFDPLTIMRFIRTVKDIVKPDVIQGWEYYGSMAASLAGLVLNYQSPVIWNIRHTPGDLADEKWLTGLIIRFGYLFSGRVQRIIYNSEVSREVHEALGYPKSHGIVIHNGFDLNEFQPSQKERYSVRSALGIPRSAILIGMIARYHPMKDHATFIKAAAALLQQNPGIHFLLVGENVDSHNMVLSQQIQEEGLERNVHLLGKRRDIPNLLTALDILSLPSAWGEGFPNIVGESMAAGIPCVVTDVGDAGRVVGETGIIVPKQNPLSLCQAWEEIISWSPEQRSKISTQARKRIAEHFSLEQMVKSYELLYSDLP